MSKQGSNLRVETNLNDPRDFKVLGRRTGDSLESKPGCHCVKGWPICTVQPRFLSLRVIPGQSQP
ncbi:MAG: hypothetical protein FJ135_16630 [Deltaproteobacteria bacterium]|nr:hypothetical protein [Deltaproteobacteria bacterium]